MDTRKIGGFLKTLRKERGLTQEQLAEALGVSGRTVSRWETGTNLPDLSILIQISEFYDVEVKEILDGERKSETMNKELKETLSRVADYNKLEKEKAAKAGNTAFVLTFAICAAAIVIQLIITGKLETVAGETVVLLVGGAVYIGMMIYHGIWETGTGLKSTPFTDGMISVICGGVFTVVLAVAYLKMGASTSQILWSSLIFFVGISAAGFTVLRMLAHFSQRRKDKNMEYYHNEPIKEKQPVNVFTANGNLQTDMILNTLKENGIAAYRQDLGDAGFASVRYGMGQGIDDRVAIMVADEQAERAVQVIKMMGFE